MRDKKDVQDKKALDSAACCCKAGEDGGAAAGAGVELDDEQLDGVAGGVTGGIKSMKWNGF